MAGRSAKKWWNSLHPSVEESAKAAERLRKAHPHLKGIRALYTKRQIAKLYGIHRNSVPALLNRMFLPTIAFAEVWKVIPLSALMSEDDEFIYKLDGSYLREKARAKEAPRYPLPMPPGPARRPYIPDWKE